MNTKILGVFSENVPIGCAFETFGVVPSRTNARWLIPLGERRIVVSSLLVYQPSLLRGRLLKELAVLIGKLGLAKFVFRHKRYLQREDGLLKEVFEHDALQYAVFLGTKGLSRKVTVQVMCKDGRILGYVKVSDSERVNRLLENEAEMLELLGELRIMTGSFPIVLFQGTVDGNQILATDTIKSDKSKYESDLGEKQTVYLANLFSATATPRKFLESQFWNDLRMRAEGSLWENSPEWQGRLKKGLQYVERNLGDSEIRFGVCHRDFTPWNTFFEKGIFYAFDWEFARMHYPPLLDLYHFIIQDGILVRRLKESGLRKRIIRKKKWIDSYCDAVGLGREHEEALLMCYLLDSSLLYKEGNGDGFDTDISRLLQVLGALIDNLARGRTLS